MLRTVPFSEARRKPTTDLAVLSKILAAIPEAVVAVGADDSILEANAPAKALIPTIRAGVPLASHMRSPDVLDAVVAARAGEAIARASWLERVPVERLFEVSVTPVEGLDCGPIVILYLHEVSQTRQFERMRIDFIANASHELRTPAGLAARLHRDAAGAGAQGRQGARPASSASCASWRSAWRASSTTCCRCRASSSTCTCSPRDRVDIVALVRHITDTLTPLAQDSGVTLAIEAHGPVAVAGDRDELMRVAENLIENAIKYGASEAVDRRVVIAVGRQRAEAVLTVRDFGIGIAPEHLPRLTERFYRVDAGQSRAKVAAPGWAWPWSSTWWRATAAVSLSTRPRTRAPPSGSRCRCSSTDARRCHGTVGEIAFRFRKATACCGHPERSRPPDRQASSAGSWPGWPIVPVSCSDPDCRCRRRGARSSCSCGGS